MPQDAATIFAPATAPGAAALAIVRVSGPAALPIVADLCGRDVATLRHGQLRRASLRDATGAALDDAMVVVFHAPRSATGEDVAELHLHGSPAVVAAVCRALSAAGAVPAGPGEFSRRAVLAGKMSLLQAEATADLIDARAESARQAALAALDGRVAAAIAALRSPLVEALAEVEARLDFGLEDDVDTLDRSELARRAWQQAAAMEALSATADAARLRLQGARVVLFGPTNAGKSTLFNSLCGDDRALVHDAPGTTRDVVEARVLWGGLEVVLVDTAGVREGAGPVEAAGIARSYAALQAADVVLWLRDAAQSRDPGTELVMVGDDAGPRSSMAPGASLLRVASRADLAPSAVVAGDVDLAVSAHVPSQVAALRAAIEAQLARRLGPDGGLVLLRERHAAALRAAAEATLRAATALVDDLPLEFVAADLRDAAAALDELIGTVVADDVLDVVFARFCIGK